MSERKTEKQSYRAVRKAECEEIRQKTNQKMSQKMNQKMNQKMKQEMDQKVHREMHQEGVPQRTYKDRLFRMIFKEKAELLGLYNAINQTHYTDPEDLEINTLENAVYLNMKNDLSFVIHTELSLYEHQSTYNPNLPIRDLFYVAKVYQGMTKDMNLYGSHQIEIPTPRFIAFYNGIEKQPERKELRLSDAFRRQGGKSKEEKAGSISEKTLDAGAEAADNREESLELKVLMININPGYNEELMKGCKTLREYTAYVDKVRTYEKRMSLEDAVEKAIDECIKESILEEFLTKYRAEAKDVSIFEYDEEKHMQQEREEWEKKGISKINQLNQMLIENQRLDDLQRAACDEEYQMKLLEEYGLD